MSNFAPSAVKLSEIPLDPTKHVNYSLGMVLGVDDFNQEFAYLAGRDQLQARELLGYGTACGLRVTIGPDDDLAVRRANPVITVAPGIALTPRGQFVSVSPAQCASLNNWLAAHAREVEEYLAGSPPTGILHLYLVLCYRDCPTDDVPIPGEPCRTEEEALAASRLADDFQLELRFIPPDQREEDELRRFIDWLNQTELVAPSDQPGGDVQPFTSREQWDQAVRNALNSFGSPIDIGAGQLRIPVEEACNYLRSAFLIWTTELRPAWLGIGASCAGTPPDENCVLLAELDVPLDGGGLSGDITLDEEHRPYLLHLRLLQEWLICGRREAAPSDNVENEVEFGQVPDPGISERYSRSDHTHGTPSLGGDVTGTSGDTTLERIQGIPVIYDDDGPGGGQVLTFVQSAGAGGSWQAIDLPTSVALAGDVTGQTDANIIALLQGVPVDAPAPEANQVLTFIVPEDGNGSWQPADARVGELDGDVVGPADANAVERILGVGVVYDEGTPNVGQVLTFVRDEEERGTWRPRDTAEGVQPLAGDVTGTTNDNTVVRILGVDVEYDEGTPADGQVLTFVSRGDGEGGAWRARDAQDNTSELGGDVTGEPGSNTISQLQGVPVIVPEPSPGQVLTFALDASGDPSWVAADVQSDGGATDVVEHPPGLGRYFIVAAGVVQGDGNPRPTVYNGLIAKVVDNGLVLVTFDGYRFAEENQYIVKVLPVVDPRTEERLNRRPVTVMFQGFREDGFMLLVYVLDQPLDPDTLLELDLMIEVSLYRVERQ